MVIHPQSARRRRAAVPSRDPPTSSLVLSAHPCRGSDFAHRTNSGPFTQESPDLSRLMLVNPVVNTPIRSPALEHQPQGHQLGKRRLHFGGLLFDALRHEPPSDNALERILRLGMVKQIRQ